MPERSPEGIHVRVGVLEDEVHTLRARTHDQAGQIAALKTLAEIGGEQRAELIKDVAELGARFSVDMQNLRVTIRWGVGLAVSGGAALGALAVQLAHM